MEYLGNDIQLYRISIEKYKWTNVTYFHDNYESGIKHDNEIIKRFNFEQKYVDHSFVCSPTYKEFSIKSSYLPLAIDISSFDQYEMPPFFGAYRILHAPTHRGNKGTVFIVDAIDKLKDEGYNIDFDIVENVIHDELKQRYKMCHLFVDQILGGWYGTASIEVMSIGRPVIVAFRKEYFQYVDFADEIPAIHADPDIIYEVLKSTLDKGYNFLVAQGKKSREFVEKYHEAKVVTKKLIEIYNQL